MAKLLIPKELKEANGKVYWLKESQGFTALQKVQKLFDDNSVNGVAIELIKTGGHCNLRWKCLNHDNPIENVQKLDNIIIGHRCKTCGRSALKAIRYGRTFKCLKITGVEEHQLFVDNIWQNKFKVLDIFKRAKSVKYLRLECLICGYVCDKRIEQIQKLSDCKNCSSKNRLALTETFIEAAINKHVGFYTYSKVEYKGTNRKVIICCPSHGDFLMTPHAHLTGQGCRKCRTSKGELLVRKLLTLKNLVFEEQKTFEGCVYKKKLRFDFYIPELNLCIEIQGIQHYKPNKLFHRKGNSLEQQQHKDKIKREFCKSNGIRLLELNSSINSDLEEIFNSYLERLEHAI